RRGGGRGGRGEDLVLRGFESPGTCTPEDPIFSSAPSASPSAPSAVLPENRSQPARTPKNGISVRRRLRRGLGRAQPLLQEALRALPVRPARVADEEVAVPAALDHHEIAGDSALAQLLLHQVRMADGHELVMVA